MQSLLKCNRTFSENPDWPTFMSKGGCLSGNHQRGAPFSPTTISPSFLAAPSLWQQPSPHFHPTFPVHVSVSAVPEGERCYLVLPDTCRTAACQTAARLQRGWRSAQSRQRTAAPAASHRGKSERQRQRPVSMKAAIAQTSQNATPRTCTGNKTLLCPIFSLASWGLNFTVKACVSPQGRFFTLSNSPLKPLISDKIYIKLNRPQLFRAHRGNMVRLLPFYNNSSNNTHKA